jgi:hypothetical protein
MTFYKKLYHYFSMLALENGRGGLKNMHSQEDPKEL